MYDELVLLAMRRTPVVLMPNFFDTEPNVFIKDLKTLSTKEEFMILSDGTEIRLDHVSSVDEHVVFMSHPDYFGEEE